jgi:hypothetical protein
MLFGGFNNKPTMKGRRWGGAQEAVGAEVLGYNDCQGEIYLAFFDSFVPKIRTESGC